MKSQAVRHTANRTDIVNAARALSHRRAAEERMARNIWVVWVPGSGEHPAAVVSVNPVNVRLSHLRLTPEAVSPGTTGPTPTSPDCSRPRAESVVAVGRPRGEVPHAAVAVLLTRRATGGAPAAAGSAP